MKNGYTLVELMIVLAILGILSGAAIPAFEDYKAKAVELNSQDVEDVNLD